MKTLLISMLLLFATNQTPKQTEKEWIGTFEVYYNEDNQFELYYNGNYSKCLTNYIINRLSEDCLLKIDKPLLDSIFQFDTIVYETKKYKTTRM